MLDQQFKDQVAAAVRGVSLLIAEHKGGMCLYRTVIGWRALHRVGIEARPAMGSLRYRVGPDPTWDVHGYLGIMPNSVHMWLDDGENIIDFSAGDWRWDSDEANDRRLFCDEWGDDGRPINWQIEPPQYVWGPKNQLRHDWKPDASPELGVMWYGPMYLNKDSQGTVERWFMKQVELAIPIVAPLMPAVYHALPSLPGAPKRQSREAARRLRQQQKLAERRS